MYTTTSSCNWSWLLLAFMAAVLWSCHCCCLSACAAAAAAAAAAFLTAAANSLKLQCTLCTVKCLSHVTSIHTHTHIHTHTPTTHTHTTTDDDDDDECVTSDKHFNKRSPASSCSSPHPTRHLHLQLLPQSSKSSSRCPQTCSILYVRRIAELKIG